MIDDSDLYTQVAEQHASNICDGFLSTLGIGFLSLLYQAIDESNKSALFVEIREGKVVGFISGGLGMRPIYRQMMRHPIRLMKSLMPSLIRPSRFWRILEVWRYSRATTSTNASSDPELMSLAVSSQYRRQSIAETLYGNLVHYFRMSGATSFKIVVGEELKSAHSFYSRMGAVQTGKIEVHRDQGSTVYTHNIG